MMNERVRSWFNQGLVKEAFLGNGEFFIPEHTYHDHDTILVMQQYIMWVLEKNQKDKYEKELAVFFEYLAKINPLKALELVATFFLVLSDFRKKNKIDFTCDLSNLDSNLAIGFSRQKISKEDFNKFKNLVNIVKKHGIVINAAPTLDKIKN